MDEAFCVDSGEASILFFKVLRRPKKYVHISEIAAVSLNTTSTDKPGAWKPAAKTNS
jgi:hypothetical protein